MEKVQEKKEVEQLSKQDYNLISQLINLSSKNGLFEGKDLLTIGILFDKVSKLCQ